MSAPAAPAGGVGWYVYGVVPASSVELLSGLPAGLGGRVPTVLADDKLGAIVGEVALDDFADEPLERNLRDEAWLEEHARRHEAVLEAALQRAPVLPFRFGTVYRGRERVLELLDAHRAPLESGLERVRGRVELGVKVFVDGERFLQGFGRRDDREAGSSSAGRAYLLERQRERDAAEALRSFASECAHVTHETLSEAADAATVNALQRPEVAGGPGVMVLNAAYLVEEAQQDRFRAQLGELESRYADQAVAYVLTGPWPPYNFVEAPAE